MRVDAEDPGNLVQTVYTGHYSNSPAILRRIRFRSTWGDWEWVNPPMIAGAEYRTTERYLGKPVYVKLLAYSPSGTIGSLDGSTDIKIPHGISGFSKLVRWSGNKSGVLLPYVTVAGASSINIADANNLTFRIVKDVFSGGTWYFQLYYTKTT